MLDVLDAPCPGKPRLLQDYLHCHRLDGLLNNVPLRPTTTVCGKPLLCCKALNKLDLFICFSNSMLFLVRFE